MSEFMNELQESEKGLICPCCNRFAKIYRRKIHTTMAVSLLRAYRKYGCYEPFHLKEIQKGFSDMGDFPKLRHWGLIKEVERHPECDKKRQGVYEVTHDGGMFVKGFLRTAKYCVTYNSEVLGFDGDMISIRDALGDKFSYNELMGY